MAGDTYTLEVLANVRQYAQGMAQIPGITEKQAAAASLRFQAQLFKAQNAAAKVGQKAARDVGDAWEAASKRLGASGELTEKLAGGLGLVSPTASVAVSAIGKVGKAASVILSPVGLAAAGLAALGAGGLAAVAGLVRAAFAADEALASLKGFKAIGSDFYPAVPPETLAALDRLNAAGEALGSIWSRQVALIGAQVAPVLERATSIVVGLALAMGDLSGGLKYAIAFATGFAKVIGGNVAIALAAMLMPLDAVVRGLVALADLAGVELPANVRAAADMLDELTARTTDAAAGMWSSATAGLDLAGTLDELERTGRAFVNTQLKANKALEGQGKAARAAKAATDDLYLNQFLAIDRQRKHEEELAATQIAKARAVTAAKLELLQSFEGAATASQERIRAATVDTFDQTLGALADLSRSGAEQTAKSNAEVSRRWFAFYQAASIGQALINGALAVTKSFADLGPVAGAIAAIGVGATTGVQIAKIASEEPPSFHTGGVVGWAPDEVPVRARRGEGFLTQRGVEAAGGAAGVAAMNRGATSSPSVSVVLQVSGRTAQRVVEIGGQQPTRHGRPLTGRR